MRSTTEASCAFFTDTTSSLMTQRIELERQLNEKKKKLAKTDKHVLKLQDKIKGTKVDLEAANAREASLAVEITESEMAIERMEAGEELLKNALDTVTDSVSEIIEKNVELTEKVSKLYTFKGFVTAKFGRG